MDHFVSLEGGVAYSGSFCPGFLPGKVCSPPGSLETNCSLHKPAHDNTTTEDMKFSINSKSKEYSTVYSPRYLLKLNEM